MDERDYDYDYDYDYDHDRDYDHDHDHERERERVCQPAMFGIVLWPPWSRARTSC